MRILALKMRGAIARVFPGCVMIGQAVAFNMFLAFFPMLLLALGFITSSEAFRGAAVELPQKLRLILPPGSEQLLMDYFMRRAVHPERWMAIGAGGTLIAGTQVMATLMHGFRIVDREVRPARYLGIQLRALLLLCVVLGPFNVVVVLTVFGRRARAEVVKMIGLESLLRGVPGLVVSLLVVLTLALVVLMVLYHIGRDGRYRWKEVLPGAFVATLLWWVVDMSFGVYVRHVPYGVVYGGLAAAIGLLLWMYMTAMVIFLGAGYNAEGVYYRPARKRAGDYLASGAYLPREKAVTLKK